MSKKPRTLSLTPSEANCILIWCKSIQLGDLTDDAKQSLRNGVWEVDARRAAESLTTKLLKVAQRKPRPTGIVTSHSRTKVAR